MEKKQSNPSDKYGSSAITCSTIGPVAITLKEATKIEQRGKKSGGILQCPLLTACKLQPSSLLQCFFLLSGPIYTAPSALVSFHRGLTASDFAVSR